MAAIDAAFKREAAKQVLFFIASLFLVGAAPLDAKVDSMFSRWNGATPGVVIAAEKNGTVVLQRAYGSADLRFDVPMRVDDRFNVGSIAKQFTAYAIYDLILSGKIARVDDPIGKYVPGLSTMIGSISVRNLLEHTSGVRDYFALGQMAGLTLEDHLDTAAVIRFANAQRATDFRPGSDYEYSNTNYVLLAEAVRDVTGVPLGVYLRDHVFNPLGMRHTELVTAHGTPLRNLVSSYWPSETGGFVERAPLLDIQGDGNLITTAGDLLLWEENLDSKTLGKRVIDLMLNRGALPGVRPAQDRFVNGLFVERFGGFERISSDGGIAGFRALAATVPAAHVSVVALSNLITEFPQDEVDAVAADLLGIALPANPASSPTPPAPSPSNDGIKAFEGRYVGREIDSTYFVCRDEGGGLVVRTLRTKPIPLRRIEGDRFTGDSWWLSEVQFHRIAGEVTGLTISGRSVRGVRLDRSSTSCAAS